jgi:hypothetical protein
MPSFPSSWHARSRATSMLAKVRSSKSLAIKGVSPDQAATE